MELRRVQHQEGGVQRGEQGAAVGQDLDKSKDDLRSSWTDEGDFEDITLSFVYLDDSSHPEVTLSDCPDPRGEGVKNPDRNQEESVFLTLPLPRSSMTGEPLEVATATHHELRDTNLTKDANTCEGAGGMTGRGVIVFDDPPMEQITIPGEGILSLFLLVILQYDLLDIKKL